MDIKNFTKNDSFQMKIDNILIPKINERLNDKNRKVEYKLNEINNLLSVDYNIDNMYMKLRYKLYGTSIGVSIRRFKNGGTLIFFRSSEEVRKDSDLFKVKLKKDFIPTVTNYLEKKSLLKLTEKEVKNCMICDNYSTDNLYIKLRNLLYDTNIDISISRKNIEPSFMFYQKSKFIQNKKKEILENKESKKVIIEHDKINTKKEKEEMDKNIKKSLEEDLKIMKLIVEPSKTPEIQEKLDEEYFCPNEECGSKINKGDSICKVCDTKVGWK